MVIIDRVRSKLEEYGLEIFNEHLVEESEQVFYVENMIIFVSLEDESIGVSFQATIKPEKSANMILILSELETEIDVMDSFIYDKNNMCLTGSKAYDLIENTKKASAVQAFVLEQNYHQLLLSTKCHEC